MVGDGKIFLDISEVVGVDVGNRVLLAVECTLLQREVQFGESQRRRRSTQCLKDRNGHGVFRSTDLKTLQIIRRVDGLLAVGDLAQTILPISKLDHVAVCKICDEFFTDLAVKYLVNTFIVFEKERKAQRVDLLGIGRKLTLGKHHGVEGSHFYHLSHLSVGAELFGCVDIDFYFAAGLLIHIRSKVFKRYMDQVGGCVGMTDLDRVFRVAACGLGRSSACAAAVSRCR